MPMRTGAKTSIQGMKVSANLQDGKPKLRLRIQRMSTQKFTKTEMVGIVIDELEFAFDDDGEFIGIESGGAVFRTAS